MQSILITTKHRGVFFGQVEDGKDLTPTTLTDIKNARMAIRWRTKNGVMELCEAGPNLHTKVGDKADINVLHDITAIFHVTEEAAEKWTNHSNS